MSLRFKIGLRIGSAVMLLGALAIVNVGCSGQEEKKESNYYTGQMKSKSEREGGKDAADASGGGTKGGQTGNRNDAR